jgi:hypothetical protein
MSQRRIDRSHAHQLLVAMTAGVVAATAMFGVEVPADAARTGLSPCVNPDNGLPVVEDIAFTPAAVDVSDSAQRVNLAMTVRDTGGPGRATGVRYVNVKVTSPEGLEIPVELHREEGRRWTGRFTVPRHAPAGEWSIEQPVVQDRARNRHGEEQLAALMTQAPWGVTLSVTSPAPDTTAPRARNLSITPNRLNSRHRPRRVHFRVEISDSGAGVARAGLSMTSGDDAASVDLKRRDGAWRGTLRIPRWIGVRPRTWRIRNLYVMDRVGSSRDYRGTRLERIGERRFRVRSGPKDSTPPRIRAVRVRPRTVDVRTERRSVRVVVRMSDRLSGVRSVTVGAASRTVELRRTSGTARRGTWTGRLRLRPCTKNIHSTFVTVQSNDRRFNGVFELTGRLRVRARDNTTPQVSDYSRRIAPTGPLTIHFNEPVNGVSSRSITVRSNPYPHIGPEESGTWSCVRGDGSNTSCLTGRVRTAHWTPDAPLEPDTVYLIELNPEGVLDLVDLAGNPFRRLTMHTGTGE